MLELKDIKDLFDENYTHNQNTRRKAADDRLFAWVTNWDDTMLSDSQNAYRGEFNIIRKGQRQIRADLMANPVQVDFQPKNDTEEGTADLLDGLFLTDDRRNSSREAYDNASLEAIDCGLGGWELCTEYESTRSGEERQVIRRKPIYEANNTSFPDSNAKALDKSDAMNWGILEPYSYNGYRDLVEALTGERPDEVVPSDFATPEQSYVFPWINGDINVIQVCRFYHKEKVTDMVVTLTDNLGIEIKLWRSQIEDIIDELMDDGYEIVDELEIERYQVTLYYCSGKEIIKSYVIAGDKIPVVHTYGERTFVEGEEIWEGSVRLAKDPQRLRNFMLSYLSEIVSRSPREKPMFYADQVAGLEYMYEGAGADNNYPYYLLNRFDSQGNELPPNPVASMPSAGVPKGLEQMIGESRAAVDDVLNPGLPEKYPDREISGDAIELIQARYDQQSLTYQHNLKHAKRWDAEIYAGMAAVVYDAPRRVTLTKADGTRQQVELMSTILDEQTGELVIMNDLTNAEFDVFAEIGKQYSSKRSKARGELSELANEVKETDPNLHRFLTLKQIQLMEGGEMLKDVQVYINKQLILGGFKAPETEEEVALLQQAQQNQQPDPMMIAAMAEMEKANATKMETQRKAQIDQFKAENDAGKLQVDAFRAETDRAAVMVDAQVSGAEIQLKQAKVVNLNADTRDKFRGRATQAA